MDVASVSHPELVLPAVPDTASPSWLVENRELIRNVKRLDAAALFGEGSELTFAMDRDTRRPVIRVVNRETREVLWQAPLEFILRMAQAFGYSGGQDIR